jgi:hypothetical protein
MQQETGGAEYHSLLVKSVEYIEVLAESSCCIGRIHQRHCTSVIHKGVVVHCCSSDLLVHVRYQG